jgi:FKBP-type peptidyl-prolyl cis-trans isomerase
MKTLMLLAALVASAGLSACSKKSEGAAPSPNPAPAASENGNGLKIEDLKTGDGTVATKGKTVQVHYTGTLTNGTKFDSSVDRGRPIAFVLGAGQVIKGWDQGIEGMRVRGKRRITIPPELGYGAQGTPGGPIPPNATLVFEVELLALK